MLLESLDEERLALSDADLDAKIDAASAYRSQLGFQFGGIDAAREQIATTGRVERFRVGGP